MKSGYILMPQSRSHVWISKNFAEKDTARNSTFGWYITINNQLPCGEPTLNYIKLPKLPGFSQHLCTYSPVSYILRQLKQHYNAQNNNAIERVWNAAAFKRQYRLDNIVN